MGAEARALTRSAPATVLTERVALPGRASDVAIGSGVRRELADRVAGLAPRARRVGWLIDASVAALWEREDGLAPPPGLGAVRMVLPAGEAAKEREVLAAAEDALLDLAREEPVVVVGGGAALDVGGLAAALAHRGHPWIALPTTVLAMADASVGGKVAVNHPRGKNLLGTFHPPTVVLADLDVLVTLPARERAAGLAEVWKAGVVGAPELVAALAAGPPADVGGWARAIHRAVSVKARLVEQDERDLGPRRALNYGHTVGHALERMALGWLHGEAVAVGMGVAARIAAARGLLDAAFVALQEAALRGLGLPVRVPRDADVVALLARLARDKKRGPGERHTFVLPRAGGGVLVADDVAEGEIAAALDAART